MSEFLHGKSISCWNSNIGRGKSPPCAATHREQTYDRRRRVGAILDRKLDAPDSAGEFISDEPRTRLVFLLMQSREDAKV